MLAPGKSFVLSFRDNFILRDGFSELKNHDVQYMIDDLKDSINQKTTFSQFSNSFIGQWTKDSFHISSDCLVESDFFCAEQAMMALKAILFSDFQSLAEIMKSTDSRECQQLGRGIKGFIQRRWDNNKLLIVYAVNLFRFNNNQKVSKIGLSENEIFVESSPDMIWGSGLNKNEFTADHLEWPGENNLGYIITLVSRRLIQ